MDKFHLFVARILSLHTYKGKNIIAYSHRQEYYYILTYARISLHTHIGNCEAIVGRCGSSGGENRPHGVPVRIRAHLKLAQLVIKSAKLLSQIAYNQGWKTPCCANGSIMFSFH